MGEKDVPVVPLQEVSSDGGEQQGTVGYNRLEAKYGHVQRRCDSISTACSVLNLLFPGSAAAISSSLPWCAL